MIRINLLPHRAEKRRVRQLQFFAMAGVSFLLGLIIVGLGDWAMRSQIAYQESRNAYLQAEIAKQDKEIEEAEALRQHIQALQARKKVVDNLQGERLDVVHLMDQMLKNLPEGLYLRSLKQSGNKISIVGYTQSNARVSTLMRSIDESPWLDTPALIEIHAAGGAGNRFSEFSLTFNLTKAEKKGKSTKKKGGE
jgi:type IV pilus assembly protein PilN